MKRRDFCIALGVIALALLLTPMGREVIAVTTYSVQGWLAHVTDETNDSLQVSIVSTDANQTIGGNLAVTGTSALTGDVTATDDVTVGGWLTIPATTVTAQSYTISSTGKASGYIVDYTDTGAATVFLPDVPADGTIILIKDGDLNGSSNNIVIATEGSDTVDEGASFTQNANGESTVFQYVADDTDWSIIGGYLE